MSRPGLSAATTASVLCDALPFITRFAGTVVVVKYGGNAMETSGDGGSPGVGPGAAAGADAPAGPGALAGFAEDMVLLRAVGILPVIVHGGGPQIGELMARLGKVAEFRDGLRVTDAETLDIARMVLVGKVNRDIVGTINVHGPLAVGLSGEDAGLITAAPIGGGLGFVGGVVSVDPTILRQLLAERLIPVIATIGSDGAGQAYNINADTVAGAIAESLGAEKLVFLTDVEGIRTDAGDPSSLKSRLSPFELDDLVSTGAVAHGMVPKAAACAHAVRNGVSAAHVIDGREPHAVLVELLSSDGVGTMVAGP